MSRRIISAEIVSETHTEHVDIGSARGKHWTESFMVQQVQVILCVGGPAAGEGMLEACADHRPAESSRASKAATRLPRPVVARHAVEAGLLREVDAKAGKGCELIVEAGGPEWAQVACRMDKVPPDLNPSEEGVADYVTADAGGDQAAPGAVVNCELL